MYVCVFIPACIVMVFVLVSKHVNCCVTLYCRSPLYVCVREVGAVQPKRWRRVIRLYVCLCVLGCGRANMLFIIICSCCYFSCCCYCLCLVGRPQSALLLLLYLLLLLLTLWLFSLLCVIVVLPCSIVVAVVVACVCFQQIHNFVDIKLSHAVEF